MYPKVHSIYSLFELEEGRTTKIKLKISSFCSKGTVLNVPEVGFVGYKLYCVCYVIPKLKI